MDRRTMRRVSALTLAAALTGCAGTGLGDILGGAAGGGAGSGTLTAEVQQVQQQQIVVRTQDGRQGAVLYDANTQVIYNNEQYPVNALEQGDVVDMRVQEVSSGYYTDLIQVVTTVQERQGTGTTGGTASDVYQVEGTIGQVDTQNETFTLNMTQGGTVSIFLTNSSPASARERLEKMLPGDYVRVEVRPVSQERAELVRFGWS